jgi:hypothetical protein
VANVSGDDQHLVTVVAGEDQIEKPKFLKKPPPEIKLYEGKFSSLDRFE